MSLLPAGLTGLPAFDIDMLCDALAGPGFAAVRLTDTAMLSALRQEAEALWQEDALTPAGIGRAEDHELIAGIRRDKTKWLDGSTPGQIAYLAFAEALRREVNARLMLGLFAFEAHFAVYEAGAFYKRHVDSFRGARNRVLSTVLYLNPDWREGDGGHLRIYGEDDQVLTELRPEFGTLAVFLSEEIPHEVTVSHRERFSIAGWHRCNDRGLAPALQVKALPIAP
ncbi:2OG-Fe(II) oxygenase [Maricaulis sp. W15]|uniref:2OG-Fe(II) oxygenase n=1 Tax=Maricaulis sp. W15 TaxID=1772333 RepID=UPI000ABBD4E5|nr:2OG-Fe(II) oxygenase [Maricaulis sp. W15]